MRARWTSILAAALLSVPVVASGAGPVRAPATSDPVVEELLARMTLAEKAAQMMQVDLGRLMGDEAWDRGPLDDRWVRRVVVEQAVGSVLSGGDAAPVPAGPAGWARTVAGLQRHAVEGTRLGIPLVYGVDAVHGHAAVVGATVYPHQLGLAATWDPALVEEVAAATARDVRATGVHWTFAPVADLGVDPRWGRYYETFGEDPALASELVAASVRGLQGPSLDDPGAVAATLKHFVGYPAGAGGRDRHPAVLTARELWDRHLPPFRAGIDAGAATVMVDSGAVDGVPVHASYTLLTDVLRGELGFAGVVVSDWHDVHKLAEVHRVEPDLRHAVERAVLAGVDLVMVPYDSEETADELVALVHAGRVPEARVDEAVRRILELKRSLGLLPDPPPPPDPEEARRVVEQGDRALAERAATASLTLLVNDGVLPLAGEVGTIAVAGPAADDPAMQLGGWTLGWQGLAPGGEVPPATTVLQGLREAPPGGARIVSLPSDATPGRVRRVARRADVVVVVLGERPYAEMEGDRTRPELPPAQQELVRELAASGTPLVLVLLAGRPLVLPEDVVEAASALLMAYLPGSQAGTAVAAVLAGDADPGGRLPCSWPRDVGQLPLRYDHLPVDEPPRPRFAFGDGLSYTSFAVRPGHAEVRDDRIVVPVEVSNRGGRAGEHVVQAYATHRTSPAMRPVRRLVAFHRVSLAAGESATVRLELPIDRLGQVPGDVFSLQPPRVEPGRHEIAIGEHLVAVEVPAGSSAR